MTQPPIPADYDGTIATALPLQPGTIGHRFTFTYVPLATNFDAGKRLAYRAKCDPEGADLVAFSPEWAREHGAVACTQPGCFPEAAA